MVKAILKRLSFSLLIAILLSVCFEFTTMSTIRTAHAASNSSNSANNVVWPEDQALPRFSPPHQLDVIDLENGPGDVSLMMSTLEGIVNRTQPRIYLIEHVHDEGTYTWLNDSHIPYQLYQDPWGIVNKYYHEAKGVIIYDPAMLDSIDVATTLAGLKDGIVVSPTLAQMLTSAPYHMPVLGDLRGKFSSALDAYTWEYQNLWPLTTHRMLIGLRPTTSITVPPDNWKDFQTVLQESNQITDGSNRQTYTIDLSNFLGGNAVYLRFQDAFPNDGWGPSVHQVTVNADGNTIAQFTGCSQQEEQYIFDHGNSSCDLSQTDAHRFADGNSYFVYRFVPPAGTKQLTVSVDMWNQFLVSASKVDPAVSSDQQVPFGYLRDYAVANHAFVFWLTDYADPDQVALFNKILGSVKPGTPYLGWFDDEKTGVTMASEHGVYVLASDWFSNLTVWSGVPAPSLKIKPVAAPALQNKVYVTFVVSDGDNLQYDEHYMRVLWNDPGRGKVPLNWSISPLLVDAAPFFLNYYQQTATPDDLLIAAPSGAGYFYPSQWPQDNLPVYLQQSNKYLQAMGTNIIYTLDENTSTMPASVGQAYAQTNLNGMFYNIYNQSTTSIANGSLPVSTQLNANNDDAVVNAIEQQAANWDGKSPLFVAVSLTAWNTTATDAEYIAQHLDSNYSVVRGDQYFQLIREANNLPPVTQ